jgi:hypothetical protein
MSKIIRTICLFSNQASVQEIEKLEEISQILTEHGFLVQTKRICLHNYQPQIDDGELLNKNILLGLGGQTSEQLKENLTDFLQSENKAINLDLTNEKSQTNMLIFYLK